MLLERNILWRSSTYFDMSKVQLILVLTSLIALTSQFLAIDVDWVRCAKTRRSTYGYSIFLEGNLVSWSVKKQPTVARSSCESEYRALTNGAFELVWLTNLLRELKAHPKSQPILLCDNKKHYSRVKTQPLINAPNILIMIVILFGSLYLQASYLHSSFHLTFSLRTSSPRAPLVLLLNFYCPSFALSFILRNACGVLRLIRVDSSD